MYTVTHLYITTPHEVKAFTKDAYTPAQFQKFQEVGTTLYISVYDDVNDTNIGINYSVLSTEAFYKGINGDTWEEVSNAITDGMVLGYSEEIPGFLPGQTYPDKPLVTWDVMNVTNTFNIAYSDHLSDTKNIYMNRWKMFDLEISLQENSQYSVNMDKCIPIINGFVCRPVYHENRLHALDGARLCWQLGIPNFTPEIQLMDFSHIGSISIKDISLIEKDDTFHLQFTNRTNSFDSSSDWILKSKYSLYDYTPIIVLCGIAIFPDRIKILNEFSCKFSITDVPLYTALGAKQFLFSDANSAAMVAYNSKQLSSYLQETLSKEDISADCFVILVNTKKLYISRTPLDVWRNGIKINSYESSGLLRKDSMHTLHSFHETKYATYSELVIQNMLPIYIADDKVNDGQLTFVKPTCKHHDFKNLNSGNCTMIRIMG